MKTGFGEVFAIVVLLAFGAVVWLAGDWLIDALHLHSHPIPKWLTLVLVFAVCWLWGYTVDLRKRVDVLESRIDRQWADIQGLRGE